MVREKERGWIRRVELSRGGCDVVLYVHDVGRVRARVGREGGWLQVFLEKRGQARGSWSEGGGDGDGAGKEEVGSSTGDAEGS